MAPREYLSSISKRYTTPSNAVALAALDAFWQPGDATQGQASGLSEIVADSFLMPRGIFPRMRLLACGWTNHGDTFRLADDKAWWGKTYAKPLWAPLGTYIDLLDSAGLGGNVSWDQATADGDPSALSRVMSVIRTELDEIVASPGYAKCAPWLIPARRGVMPLPNLACVKVPDAGKAVPKIPSLTSFPWWAWLALGYLVTRKR